MDHIPVRVTSRPKHSTINCITRTSRNLVYCSNGRNACNRPKRIPQRKFPSILLSNVRSLSNKMVELELRQNKYKPGILVLTETWLDDTTPDTAISISGYHVVRKDRNQYGGGVIYYISHDFDFVMIEEAEVTSLSLCVSEIFPIIFPTLNLLMIALYHPFWRDSVKHQDAISCVIDVIEYVFSLPAYDPESTKVIICGDFNDLINNFDDVINTFHLKAIVQQNTRGNRILDQIFTNINTNSSPTISAPLGKSDHAVVFWNPDCVATAKVLKKKVRNFSKSNMQSFHRTISLIDWDIILQFSDLDIAAIALNNVLWFIYDDCFPLVTVRFRNTDPPWMSAQLKLLMDKRDRAYRDKQTVRYCELRNDVVTLSADLQKNYLKTVENAADCKDAWKRIRLISRNHTDRASSNTCMSAHDLNVKFSSVFEANSDYFDSSLTEHLPDHPLFVSEIQVNSLLRQLKRGNGGPTNLPYWIFKENSMFLSRAITFILNNSFLRGRVPFIFKFADVVPIPKCSRPSTVSDYRPISIMPVITKIMEKVVLNNWMLPYLSQKLDPMQFAYVPGCGKGTSNALTLMNNHILRFLDGKAGAVRMIAADYSKAFDKLSFFSIISSLVKFELPRQAILFIFEYLRQRYQRVKVGCDFSDWTVILSGVPQGSIIGPLFFAAVIDSLQPVQENSLIIKYADDVTLLHFVRDQADDHTQIEWENLENWSNDKGLKLNYSKCNVLNFVTKKSLIVDDIMLSDGGVLATVHSLKILGVIISDNFKWNEHVKFVISKCYKRFFILRNLKRSGCPSTVIFKCYVAFIRSLINYAYPCFCNLSNYLLNYLIRVERRAARFFKDVDFLTLPVILERFCENLFKLVESKPSHSLRTIFRERCPTQRNSSTLTAPRAVTSRYSNSFIRFGRT